MDAKPLIEVHKGRIISGTIIWSVPSAIARNLEIIFNCDIIITRDSHSKLASNSSSSFSRNAIPVEAGRDVWNDDTDPSDAVWLEGGR
jgi:hypothetical protein